MKPLFTQKAPVYIAGVQFVPMLPAEDISGKEVTLRHNEKNKYDSFAVEVHYGNFMLGHMPKTTLADVHELARQEIRFRAGIVKDNGRGVPPYERYQINIWVDDLIPVPLQVPHAEFKQL